jgi:excisionase family DNA binding protein
MSVKYELLTVKQTAERLGVSSNTVRTWGASGKLPEYRHPLNNYRLFKVKDVEKLRRKLEHPVLKVPAQAKRTNRCT